jgi:plastocyanin domain-containing protein
MDIAEVAVIAGGAAAIAFVILYFFGGRKKVAAAMKDDGVQEVDITVKGGYSPDVIVVRRGVPVRLNFYRDETSECSDQVIIGDFGIFRELPAFKTTSVEFEPDKAGEFNFTCGMNMLHGKLIVEPS